MKFLVLLMFLTVPTFFYGQNTPTAVGRYSEGGKLISLSNLSGLSDCAAASLAGKISKVKVSESVGHATVKTEDSTEFIDVPLERLKPDERSAIFKNLVRKSVKVRIAGYRCNSTDPITAFSIDRIY